MHWSTVVITGVSGAGKSTLSQKIRSQDPSFAQVTAVTTRSPRADDEPDTYEYVSPEEFEHIRDTLLIEAEYRSQRYGISQRHVDQVLRKGRIPIVVITPDSVERFVQRAPNPDACLTIFVDAPDSQLHVRLGDRETADALRQRAHDREYRRVCLRSIENVELNESVTTIFQWLRTLPSISLG